MEKEITLNTVRENINELMKTTAYTPSKLVYEIMKRNHYKTNELELSLYLKQNVNSPRAKKLLIDVYSVLLDEQIPTHSKSNTCLKHTSTFLLKAYTTQ